ncbi:uncharacterized protein [Leptinotarsa decemlineata]|uniref:uncharacterized protein n=1 Tax=Leptinotarsa decemlineata TaxID=7539 RepID=UPI003D30B7EF
MNSNRLGGLPPQYPYPRRGSNTPVSSLALASHPPAPPNRSRSLDGLLDAGEAIQAASEATKSEQVPSPQTATKSCDNIDKDFRDDYETESYLSSKSRVSDDSSELDKCSVYSSSSESKRKRNFMDRCVNKVRSMIKK